jgi:hypothetical protein
MLYVGGWGEGGIKSCMMYIRNSPVHERDLQQELQDGLLLLGRRQTGPRASLIKNKLFYNQSLYSKKNAVKSRLFLTVHKHNLAGLGGRYTDFLRVDSFCIHFPDILSRGKCVRLYINEKIRVKCLKRVKRVVSTCAFS